MHISADASEESAGRALHGLDATRVLALSGLGYAVEDRIIGKIFWSSKLIARLRLPRPRPEQPLREVLAPAIGPHTAEALQGRAAAVLVGGHHDSVPLTVPAGPGGLARHLRWDIHRDGDRLVHVVEDITGAEEQIAELMRDRDYLLRAQRLSAIGHASVHLESGRLFLSATLADMLEVARVRAGHPAFDFAAALVGRPAARELTRAVIRACREQRVQAREVEVRLPGTGEPRRLAVEAQPNSADPGVRVVPLAVRDLSDQRERQVALEVSERRFRMAETMARIGHYLHRFDSGLAEWSPGLFRILGAPPTPDGIVPEATVRRVVVTGNYEGYQETVRRALTSGARRFSWLFECRNQTTGGLTYLKTEHEFVYDADGRAATLFGVAQDVTRDMAADRERAELERLVREAQRTEALSYFAAGLAHEVANILQPALSQVSLATDALAEDDLETVADSLERVTHAISRAASLTRGALDHARSGDASEPPEPFGVTLSEVRRTVANLADTMPEWRVAPDVYGVETRAGAIAMTQVVLNLLQNAREAAGARVAVEIRVTSEDDGVTIRVEDDGPGMSVEAMRRAFRPFFTARRGGGGSGLGLAITRSIVERWGGRITVEPGADRGTVFTVTIPAA